MRRRKKKGALEKYKSYTQYDLYIDDTINDRIADFKGNSPLYIELGAGRAAFAVEVAHRNPQAKVIAIEYKEELLLYACEEAIERNIHNIKFIQGYIDNIEQWMQDLKTDIIYLNFSDPWPKSRHSKKRLTHINFLNLYKKILNKDGKIEVKTDQKDLYEFTLEQLEEAGFKIQFRTTNLGEYEQDNIMTDYEIKFRAQNNPIYKIIATL